MRSHKSNLKEKVFKLLVFASVCVIFYYTAGRALIQKEINASSQANGIQVPKEQRDFSSGTVLKGKPLPINTPKKVEEKVSVPAISNVRLAELKNGEQTVVMEDNANQPGTVVILAAKGVRAKWVFRFKDGKACNGKISIKRFGMIIPVVEKEMEMTFAPLDDFTVTCDKGKFNYYIKVADNLYPEINTSTAQAKNTPNTNASNNIQPSTKSSSTAPASSAKQSTKDSTKQVTPKEGESKPTAEPSKPISTPAPTNIPDSRQEPTPNDKTEKKPQEEPKKNGILDHLFHHNH